MSVICKFQCHNMLQYKLEAGSPVVYTVRSPEEITVDADGECHVQIRLGAVWAGSTEAQQASENAIFGKWTPMGELNMTLKNPEAVVFFKHGKKYYITITEAPD